MKTEHKFKYSDARDLSSITSESINVVVTSPPYPMISMWDDVFSSMNPEIKKCLDSNDGQSAYKLMHAELFKVWKEVFRVLCPGGFACINMGDATRNIKNDFRLYPNHAEVINQCSEIGFFILPEILWRKPTNSPTKFLGSGMLPCGAYVTLEHETILIFRKPDKRNFKSVEEKDNRNHSSYFWEERNKWFSDIWELNGKRQVLNSKEIRKRSGAFPFEIPYRLINMFSSKSDTILDPFVGTGTTTLAAVVLGRNSIGYEVEKGFSKLHEQEIMSNEILTVGKNIIENRVKEHESFIKEYSTKKQPKYKNRYHKFDVITRQEINMQIDLVTHVKFDKKKMAFIADYSPYQQPVENLKSLRDDKMGAKKAPIKRNQKIVAEQF